MEEALVEVVDKTPLTTPPEEPSEPAKTEAEPTKTEAPKNKGGRPAGAKDRAPRKKTVVIVAETIPQPRAEREKPAAVAETPKPPPPAPMREPEPVHEEPPSPRAIIRESARHMLDLKRLNETARKSHLQSAYIVRLAKL